MLMGLLGAALILWAFWAEIGARVNNRAQIFQDPVGSLVNLEVIIGGVLIYDGFVG